MSHERSDRIRLPADKARCEPSNVGQASHICARYKAAIPSQGAAVEDFSRHAGCSVLCSGFISLSSLVAEPVKVAPRVFKGF